MANLPPSLSAILHAKLILAQSSAKDKKQKKGRKKKASKVEKEKDGPKSAKMTSMTGKKKISIL